MWASGARFEGACTSKILCLDWMPSQDGLGGWLATGCSNGTVGVSWIYDPDWSCDEGNEKGATYLDMSLANVEEFNYYKSHFILKGHLGEVCTVKWRPNGDRLASCDSWGKVIVWLNRAHVLAYEFQLTVPFSLIDLQWSPCGHYYLLCGKDGQLQLHSSINGTNFFSVLIESNTTPSTKAQLVCCDWNLPGTRIALGTENGEVIILDPNERGTSMSTIVLDKNRTAVQSLSWFGPIFEYKKRSGVKYETQGLSVYLRNGDIILLKSIESCISGNKKKSIRSKTNIVDGKAAWNMEQDLCVIVGYENSSSVGSQLTARFVDNKGYIMYTLSECLPVVPQTMTQSLLRNVTWAFNDSAILMTWGCHLYSVALSSSLPSLQTMCRKVITDSLHSSCRGTAGEKEQARAVQQLPLPKREMERLLTLSVPLISDPLNVCSPHILKNLFQPVPDDQRFHCILEETEFGYVLKYEYFNQYRPFLNARKVKSGFMSGGYQIEPAFDCNHLEQTTASKSFKSTSSSQSWATKVDGKNTSQLHSSRPHFFKQLKTVLKSGLNPSTVTDVAQERRDISAATASPPAQREPKRPIIAEVEGNSIVNRFRFHTNNRLFEDGYLGALNISTNYVKCKPRRLTVHLKGISSSGSFDEMSMQSKEPDWNDRCQVYELDFGGRVSHDSVKNFQIERDDQVVMQFGKSDSKHFCLDFQAPFSPVQALCVALTCLL